MVSLAKAFALLTILNKLKLEYEEAMADGHLSFEELSDLIIGFVVGIAKAMLPGMPDEVLLKLSAFVEMVAASKDKVEAKVAEVKAVLDKADAVYEKFEAEIKA